MTRWVSLIAAAVSAGATALSAVLYPAPRLIWNASASEPIGLYAVRPAGQLRISELVVVAPPSALATYMDRRRYLPAGAPMLKEIAALPGQIVCRDGHTVRVAGVAVGDALDRDFAGRALPFWQGCQRVDAGQVFLMNERSRVSFDGRYFGVLPAARIVGRASPLWLRRGG